MAYTSQARGLFDLIRNKGVDGLSDSMKRTYINKVTLDRADKILALAKETSLSPTALSLSYLLYDEKVNAYPIIGTSRPERIAEAMQALTLGEREIKKLFS